MKKMLMVASVAPMIGSFHMNHISVLQDMGYEVHVACNFKDTSVWPAERINEFAKELIRAGVFYHQVEFSRSPKNIKKIQKSFTRMDFLLKDNEFDFVHCHTPLASAITRIICHRYGVKVMYTAHGFHFYDGAPVKNWLVYYPVEKILSRFTDILITINKEDYKRAKRRFHAKKTKYIPGVGVDTNKFAPSLLGRERIRKELNVPKDRTVLLSVGELNENKNHEIVIKAIRGMNLTYVIVGKGKLAGRLRSVAEKLNVDLRLMGFRADVADFYNAADLYILPSLREGLNVSLMEAMASGLAVACGHIRGNTDLVSVALFNPLNIDEIKASIKYAMKHKKRLGSCNLKKIQSFDIPSVQKMVMAVYQECRCMYQKEQSVQEAQFDS